MSETQIDKTVETRMTPGEEIRLLVREQMKDVRIQLGETSEEAEAYEPRHGAGLAGAAR